MSLSWTPNMIPSSIHYIAHICIQSQNHMQLTSFKIFIVIEQCVLNIVIPMCHWRLPAFVLQDLVSIISLIPDRPCFSLSYILVYINLWMWINLCIQGFPLESPLYSKSFKENLFFRTFTRSPNRDMCKIV